MKLNLFSTLSKILKRQWIFILSGVFCIAVDQILKQIARLTLDTSHYIIPELIGWEYFENTGIAFGIPVPHSIVIPLTVAIILTGFWYMYRTKHSRHHSIAVVLIISGALSNLCDRILYGFTIDYIRIFTSIFNLADICIVLGMFLLLRGSKKTTASEKM